MDPASLLASAALMAERPSGLLVPDPRIVPAYGEAGRVIAPAMSLPFGAPAMVARGKKGLKVQDVFATSLYTGGTSGVTTVTNGIDLAGNGGLVWIKQRDGTNNHVWRDTQRGLDNWLKSNLADAQASFNVNMTALSSGFSFNTNDATMDFSGKNYASWTFRKAARFFDVVTWAGNGSTGRLIPHNLGVTPGMIIVKSTSKADNWNVWHRSISPAWSYGFLNRTNAFSTGNNAWDNGVHTATHIMLGNDAGVNMVGQTYVAYLFAHDPASDGVIQCGSYMGTGATGNTIDLGWEPQFVMVKKASAPTTGAHWYIYDSARGMTVGVNNPGLVANLSDAEAAWTGQVGATSSGFEPRNPWANDAGQTFVYLAIRKGPM